MCAGSTCYLVLVGVGGNEILLNLCRQVLRVRYVVCYQRYINALKVISAFGHLWASILCFVFFHCQHQHHLVSRAVWPCYVFVGYCFEIPSAL